MTQDIANVMGLDISYRSPGICILDTSLHRIFFYYFEHRKRQSIEIFESEVFDFNLPQQVLQGCVIEYIPMIRPDINDRYVMCDHICRAVVDIAMYHDVDCVILEGYAYRQRSISAYILYELTGHLKCMLHAAGYSTYTVPPTAIKKTFTGGGKAEKIDMFNSFMSQLGGPDLRVHLNAQSKKPNIVQHPVQDMVDSLAAIYWYIKRYRIVF